MTSDFHQSLVSRQFGNHAQAYLDSPTHADGEDLALMAEWIGARSQAIALDLGCGAGHAAFRLAPLVDRVIAYDLSADMLAVVADQAQRRGLDNIATRQGAVEHLPFADVDFDVVVSRYSAHHWPDPAVGLAEMRRVLKPAGLVLLMDVIAPGTALADTWLQSLELLRDPSHVRDYSLVEWQALLAATGFRTLHVRTFRRRLAFGPWVARMQTPPTQVAAIRNLQHIAPQEVIDYFAIESDGSFTGDTVLIAAEIAGGRS